MPDSLMTTYTRLPVTFDRGAGAWLWDSAGKKYLDAVSGVAVCGLGHAHPAVTKAICEQAGKLVHTSNLYGIANQQALGDRLTQLSGMDKVFFSNSGAEANEAAIKLARLHGHNKGIAIPTIVVAEKSFHGRTLATLTATGNPKYAEGVGPLPDGFDQVPFGDLKAVAAAIRPETAAIMIEPIQGEGGIRLVPASFLRELRALCDKHGLLLVFDEIQSGVGRTGKLFAYEWSGVSPDVMTVAKGIGGGFPMGACLATADAAKGMTTGIHGTTFGGNPLAMAVGKAVIDIVSDEAFLARVRDAGIYMKQRLASVADSHSGTVAEVRGEGLLVVLRCVVPAADVVAALRDHGMLAAAASDNVVRLLPPLIVTNAEIDEAVARLDAALTTIEQAAPVAKAG
jgi:acetylornithine/N-succinyldiaminopimelate aminotransferase